MKARRILILGGGFGGVYTARHLERLARHESDFEIVLVSRDNFLLMTPLLFEVFSGTLDVRHCSFPVRAFLQRTRLVEAAVRSIDLERRVVHLGVPGEDAEISYDQWTFALLFRPDIVKIGLESEVALLLRELEDDQAALGARARTGAGANCDKDRRFSGAQPGGDHDHAYRVPGRAASQQTAGFPHATGGGA